MTILHIQNIYLPSCENAYSKNFVINKNIVYKYYNLIYISQYIKYKVK